VAIRCPQCGREYDVSLFQFDRTIQCDCGRKLELSHFETLESLKHLVASIEEEGILKELQRKADHISSEILDNNYSPVDIQIHINALRAEFEVYFPGKGNLFSMIYEARFHRLWQQFRRDQPPV